MENFIIKDENALYFEIGYSCDNALFLAFGNDGYFITDGRYEVEAKEHLKQDKYSISLIISRDLVESAREILKKYEKSTLIYNPQEFSVYAFEKLTSDIQIEFLAKPNFHQEKRIIKTQEEIALLDKSQRLNFKAFAKFITDLKIPNVFLLLSSRL